MKVGKKQKRNANKLPAHIRDVATTKFTAKAQRAYRSRRLGKFGAASAVRHIDPNSKGK